MNPIYDFKGQVPGDGRCQRHGAGDGAHVRLARVAGLTKEEWQAIKPAVLPLLRGVQPRIVESLNWIRTFDGQRLPSADWHIVRSIVMERDKTCLHLLRFRQAAPSA